MAASIFNSEVAADLKSALEALAVEQYRPRAIIVPPDQVRLWEKWIQGEWADTPVCECGVKFTGGMHSDWCPCAGEE